MAPLAMFAVTLPYGLHAENMKTIMATALGLWVGLFVLSMWVTKKVVSRALAAGLFASLTFFTYIQRGNLIDCVDQIKKAEKSGTTCSVAGVDVRIPSTELPSFPKPSSSTPTTTG